MAAKTISFTMAATPKAGQEQEFLTGIENPHRDEHHGQQQIPMATAHA